MKLPSLEARSNKTADLVQQALPNVSRQDILDALNAFHMRLHMADIYEPKSKYEGNALLIKASHNRSSKTLGEDYSLSNVSF